MIKVRIKKLPQARTGYQVQGSLANDVPAMGGADYNTYTGKPKLQASKYITAVPREEANLEAEGGETVYGDINGDGMPEHKTIKGPRHSGGGVPLSLPDDTFIYSDFRGMNLKDPNILNKFGKGSTGKKSYTPAELAKQYDIEKYRKILEDPDSDTIDKKTAELMIKNYTQKLGALALAQESKKGFPQGIPAAAKPYMEINGIKEDQLVSPEIQGLSSQVEGQLQQSQNPNADETDESEAQDNNFEEAQELNQGQPVATPEAQQGMSMGVVYPYTEESGDFLKQAQYGMPMGVNSGNYAGRPHTPRYQRGGGLTQYQDKGEVKSEPIDVTGKTDAEIHRMMWEAQQKDPKAQPVFKRDGEELTYKPAAGFNPTEAGAKLTSEDLKTHGFKTDTPANRAAAAQYMLLEKELNNPVSLVRKELIAKTRATLEDPRAFTTKRGKVLSDLQTKLKDKKLTDQEIVKGALRINKRNHTLAANGFDSNMFIDDGSKLETPEGLVKKGVFKNINDAKKAVNEYNTKKWTSTKAAINEVGAEPINEKTLDPAIEQATIHGFRRMQADLQNNAYKNEPDKQYALSGFLGNPDQEMNEGANDEKDIYGGKGARISPIDNVVQGDTSTGEKIVTGNQIGTYEKKAKEPANKVEKKCPCQKSDGTVIDVQTDPNTGECNECTEDVNIDIEKPAETWLQDTIKTTGAFGDLMKTKKYMPWAPSVNLQTPKASFMDPTRELAANSEQANIQMQALGQFTGPQAMSARSSSVQGQAAKNAADVLGRYNNANVNTANQFETNNANIMNQEAGANQAIKGKLYDQNTIANQQFDNSRMALRNNLRNQYANSITNKWKTDALNQMFPQYETSAAAGGRLHFTQGKDNKAEHSKTWAETHAEHMKKGATYDEATRATNGQLGKPDERDTPKNPHLNEGQYGGFIYGDHMYPFIH